MNKNFTRKEIADALIICLNGNGCDSCAFKNLEDCIGVRNEFAAKYIMENTLENKPLSLDEIIDILRKKQPIFILKHGWALLKNINIFQDEINIRTTEDYVFVYKDNESIFYRYEVKNE